MILQRKLPLCCPATRSACNGFPVCSPCTCCLCLKGRGSLSVLGVVLVPSANDYYRTTLWIHVSTHLSPCKHMQMCKKTPCLVDSGDLSPEAEAAGQPSPYHWTLDAMKGIFWLSDCLTSEQQSRRWNMFWGHKFWVRFSHIWLFMSALSP